MADRTWVTRAVIVTAVVVAVVVGSIILWTAGGGDGADETAEVEAADEAPTESATAVDAGPSTDEGSSASPTPTAAAADGTSTDGTSTDGTALDGTPLEEAPTDTPPADPVEPGPGGSVLAATDLCGGWTEFTDTFLSMMGGDLGGEPEDPEAVHAYFQAAMQDLAALSPTDEIRDAHLVLATSTLEEFTGQTVDISPRLEAAFTVLDEELTQLCPGPGGG